MYQKYDIRGIYPKEINEGVAKFIALEFYRALKKRKIPTDLCVAQDLRKSSIKLVNSIIENYLGNSTYLGILPSPVFYWYCIKNKKAGIMVTASHLPMKFNGFKFLMSNNKWWRYLGKIKKLEHKRKFLIKEKIEKRVYDEYLKDLKIFARLKKEHSFYYKKCNSANIYLFKEIPKIFKNIKISKKADIILKSDFDGDRIEIYYKNKKLLPEEILYIVLKTSNYKKIGLPININKKIIDLFPYKKIYFIKTGHYNFKKAYEKYNIDFAIETSFHIYFFKEMKTEAPLLVLFKIFEFDEKYGLDVLKNLDFPVHRFNLNKKINLDKIKNILILKGFKFKKFDGYNFYNKNCSINIRESETTKNLFRINIESNNRKILLDVKKWLMKIL